MHREDFFQLIDKWTNGTASEEELQRLMNYYHSFPEQEWDNDKMGSRAELEAAMEQELLSAIRQPAPVKVVRMRPWLRIAAAVTAVIAVASGITWTLRQPTAPASTEAKPIAYRTVATEHLRVALPDSTIVYLSPNTTMEQGKDYGRNDRTVTLTGEAFFDIRADSKKPFKVQSGQVTTQVLGTSFNVQAYTAQQDIAVTVLTGKVAVSSGVQQVECPPGNRAVFNKQSGNLLHETGVDTRWILEHQQGILRYDRANLQQVADQLGYYYNVKITISGSTASCSYVGEFNTRQPLDKALKQLCLTLNATLEHQNNTYYIRMNGC
ncbi:FecR family protein [Chitinophaga jiangningensis]|uniref:FecR family protein n=1 Tax=Chitinophaga jiangningensis TaxID=1419482 RepID=A0A1M7AEY4_9BACT|nr:FecR domain-containing protein [Chitinophaga jiangningensis]SHL41353.1 FecR family protein [Chitinophaga jiangningensis]